LTSSQISITLTQTNQAYTLARQQLAQFSHDVNITLSGTIDKNLVKTPTYASLQTSLLECGRQTLDPTATAVYKQAQTFSVGICGSYLDETRLDMFAQAIYKAWLEMHPEFLPCVQVNNCLKVNSLSVRTQPLDSLNAVKQLAYVVLVNGVVIDPSQATAFPPNAAVFRKYIELIPARNNMNYLLCAAGPSESLVSALPIEASFFSLLLNRYIFDKPLGLTETFRLVVRTALIEANPLFSTNSLDILLNNRYEEVVVYNGSSVDPNQVTQNLPVKSSFQLFLNASLLSQATQTLFDVATFYAALQRRIDATPTLAGLRVLNSNQVSYLVPSDLIRLRTTSRLSFSDVTVLPAVYTSFIRANKIEFGVCQNCWNVVVREPVSGLEMVVRLAAETGFNQKMSAGMGQLANSINSQISLFNFNATSTSRVVTLPDEALRRLVQCLFRSKKALKSRIKLFFCRTIFEPF